MSKVDVEGRKFNLICSLYINMICVTELVQFWQETSNCLFRKHNISPSDQSYSTYFVFTQMYFVLRYFLCPCLWMSAGAFAVPLSSSCSLSCTDKWLGCRRCCLHRLPATQHEPFGPRRWLRMQPLEQATRCGCLLISMSSHKHAHKPSFTHLETCKRQQHICVHKHSSYFGMQVHKLPEPEPLEPHAITAARTAS